MITNLIISTSSSPYHNLAYEYELLEKAASEQCHILFLYRNVASVVMGRFQNPWREINFKKLPKGTNIVRRHSGGGTVYHDLGNWNFSFIRPGDRIDEILNLEIITETLKKFSLRVEINNRFDLIHLDKKVSGSAFRKVKGATLHHGTLLVDAKLDYLRGSLGKNSDFTIEGKGVMSVSSAVCNLGQFAKDLTWDNFVQTLEEKMEVNKVVWGLDLSCKTEEKSRLLSSWQWLWGQGPKAKFYFPKHHFLIAFDKGIVVSAYDKKDDQERELSSLLGLEVRSGVLDVSVVGDHPDRINLTRLLNEHFFNSV